MPAFLSDFSPAELPAVVAAGLFGGSVLAFVVAALRAMRL
jgi:ABC-type uncharacterized transport system permease subunit